MEVDYLKGLSAAVSMQDWTAICARAVRDAKRGDARARAWLSLYLLGSDPSHYAAAAAVEAEKLAEVRRELDTASDPERADILRRRMLSRSMLDS